MADRTISHDWQDESIEAKARWFQSLSLAERMAMLCWFTDLMLTANPRIVERKDGTRPIPAARGARRWRVRRLGWESPPVWGEWLA